jgi:hypothetical protein
MVHVDRNDDDNHYDSEDNRMYSWDELPHFIWDNSLSGDQIFDYMSNKGFGALNNVLTRPFAKCNTQQVPLNKKTDTSDKSKVRTFNKPIVLVCKPETYQ